MAYEAEGESSSEWAVVIFYMAYHNMYYNYKLFILCFQYKFYLVCHRHY
jgi:hypothetical protein